MSGIHIFDAILFMVLFIAVTVVGIIKRVVLAVTVVVVVKGVVVTVVVVGPVLQLSTEQHETTVVVGPEVVEPVTHV